MKKRKVLEVFRMDTRALKPDTVRARLLFIHKRTTVYSYLLRLHRQGLLTRTRIGRRIAYELSARGLARLNYFKERENQ